jgi:hypothetical protein
MENSSVDVFGTKIEEYSRKEYARMRGKLLPRQGNPISQQAACRLRRLTAPPAPGTITSTTDARF